MTVASVIKDTTIEPHSITSSPLTSKQGSDTASETDPSDRNDQFDSPVVQRREIDVQSPASLKSEEYRQLFRLQWDEILVQDFNCAFQESILLQGHMYLFVHNICFYSNIFGFETKKIIPFDDVTSVRKAKTAAIFPNAIEISTGEKKHFFASFLSRDEAFRLIVEGWELHHSNNAEARIYREDSKAELRSQEDGHIVFERLKTVSQPSNDAGSVDRYLMNRGVHVSGETKLFSNGDADISLVARLPAAQENREEDAKWVVTTECVSSSGESSMWKMEDAESPKVAGYYTKVAESKFPISVEEFFILFCSEDAAKFIETFHERCGDKEFRCSSWYKHEQFGHARELSFQHPIKIYFGAKSGRCQEVQKFRVYRNSHLVIETSQEVSEVPYGDYFHVEGLWDVENDGDEINKSCILRVYTNVVFSKKTMWKGKIEQSTVEECREAYALWLNHAHELLKQRSLTELDGPADIIQNDEVQPERHDKSSVVPETIHVPRNLNSQLECSSERGTGHVTSTMHLLRESLARLCLYLKSQNHLPLILFMVSVSILLLMQLTIIVLLTRAPQVHLVSQLENLNGIGNNVRGRAEDVAWLEKRVHHLKDEMFIVEARLEKMQHEHALLKSYLKGLELLK